MQSTLKGELNPQLDDAPDLRDLRDYWRSKFNLDDIPGRAAIEPSELKSHLGSLFIVEPLPGQTDFRYRLIGADLTAIHGREFTGTTVREMMSGLSQADAEAMINAYQIVVRKHVVLRASGTIVWAQKEYLDFDSIHMPIRGPNGHDTWLLGKMIVLKSSSDVRIPSSLRRNWEGLSTNPKGTVKRQ